MLLDCSKLNPHGEPFVTSNVVAVVFIIVLCLFEYRLLTPHHFLSSSKLIMFVIPFCAAAATLSVSVCLLNWKSLTRYLNVLLKKLNNKWRKQLGCLKIIWLLRCCCCSSSSSNSDKTYLFLFFCSCCIFLQPCQMFVFFTSGGPINIHAEEVKRDNRGLWRRRASHLISSCN